MASYRGSSCAQPAHLEALCQKKTILEQQIEDAQKHPSTSDLHLRELKMKRLHLKEKIEMEERHQSA